MITTLLVFDFACLVQSKLSFDSEFMFDIYDYLKKVYLKTIFHVEFISKNLYYYL